MMKKIRGLLLFFCCFLFSAPVFAQVDPSQGEPPDGPENKSAPYLELHGDYRYLYGKGRFNGRTPNFAKGGTSRSDAAVHMLQRRLRLFPTLHTSGETMLKCMLEDRRDDKNHSLDQHLTLSRLYLQHENPHSKWELGRFNYYLMDGNVLDKRVDGVRMHFGSGKKGPGRFSFFFGQTTGDCNLDRKKGWSILYEKERGKLKSRSAFLDFSNRQSQPESLPGLKKIGLSAGRSGTGFDRQQIWTSLYEYRPDAKWNLSLELLHSKGWQYRDHYKEKERGFVAAATCGRLDEKKAGSWAAWVRYYDQPQSSILYHTMDGDTGFFRRMGFRGWGVRADYVLTPGLVWAVEGFRLKNKKDGPATRDFHEYVLGTSLTAYF